MLVVTDRDGREQEFKAKHAEYIDGFFYLRKKDGVRTVAVVNASIVHTIRTK